MEHEMKLSSSAVRTARIERGWSQEQLAVASGLSLRTVQRVEAEGFASLGTAASLAATYGVPLVDLQAQAPRAEARPGRSVQGVFLIALAILMLAAIGESGRLPGTPQAAALAAMNILLGIVGTVLLVASGVRILMARHYVGAALAVVGTPCVVLLVGGLITSALAGRAPMWPTLGIGMVGVALVAMAMRVFARDPRIVPT